MQKPAVPCRRKTDFEKGQAAAAAASSKAPPKAAPAKQDNSWDKVPKKAHKGQKPKKGQKVDAALLGFDSGINFNVLEH